MGRVIKTNLGKYANPKLAEGTKVAVLASVVEYLNGEEFVRIVSAPLTYQSPDFVRAMEEDQEPMGVTLSPTKTKRCQRLYRYKCQRWGIATLSSPWLDGNVLFFFENIFSYYFVAAAGVRWTYACKNHVRTVCSSWILCTVSPRLKNTSSWRW